MTAAAPVTIEDVHTARARIEGKIQYGELAVDAGGTLDGEIRGHGKTAKPKAKATGKGKSGK